MSHPDLLAPPDTRPIEVGEDWVNPVTRERAVILELPWLNDEGRLVSELTWYRSYPPGARVVGEHMHPALVERLSVEDGELTVLLDGRKSVLGAGEQAEIQPGVWHDWWNEADRTAIVRVEVTPGERFVHLIETLFGLARGGHVNKRGMPHPLQLALLATEFSDIIVFRKPPAEVQRPLFGILAPLARRRGYRATYPSLSRTTLAPRVPRDTPARDVPT
jgi:mannose-6-phosphate isomerase-like protein (cupin superfamily)